REFSNLDVVSRSVSLGSFVPSNQEDKLAIIDDINFLLGPDLAKSSASSPPTPLDISAIKTLHASLKEFVETGNESEREAALALQSAITSMLTRIQESSDPQALLKDLDQILVGVLPDTLAALRQALTASEIELESLPKDLQLRWVANDGRARVDIFPRYDIMNEKISREFVAAVQSIDATATGLPVIHQQAGDAVLQAFVQAFTSAIIVVSVLLFIVMRNVRDVILILAPLVVAGLVTGAVTVLFGIPFNFANIIALPLLLGMGVDNGIHMVHRARVAPPSTGNLLETSTARGVVFSALTTIFSFGSLAFSRHVGTASMGELLTIGMVLTVIATLIILPAMIHIEEKR
ncbi:MAG: MMPL family transporter, partial [Gammaproteobacteria bacterium]